MKACVYDFLLPLRREGRGGTTERVQAALREAIIGSDIPPGADIDKQEVCERLGVSRFPVSEALARLAAEGLVEILPQRATRATRIRIGEVHQNIFIRRALETAAVRALAPGVDAALIADIDRNLQLQAAAVAADDRRRFDMLDLSFHSLLLEPLRFPRVKATVDAARSSLERVRRLLGSPRRQAASLAQHRAIAVALSRRDPLEAATAMERHLDDVVIELVALAGEIPSIFEDA